MAWQVLGTDRRQSSRGVRSSGLKSGCRRLRVSDLCRTLESGGCRLAFLFCNTGHTRKWRDPLHVHERSLWLSVEDRLEGARVEAGSPVSGRAAVGARGGGSRAVGGGRDRRGGRWLDWEPSLNVEWLRPVPCVLHLQIHLDSVCVFPLCHPTPTADFSSFLASLGILLHSNQEVACSCFTLGAS